MKPDILIYTDGSCPRNPGPNGWAFVHVTGKTNYYASGYRKTGTNNTAEMRGVLNAMYYVEDNGWLDKRVRIVTDSMYVVNGMMGWRHTESVHGFKNIKNGRLWLVMHQMAERIPKLRVEHIKGHAGHYWNEYCDRMAGAAVREGNTRRMMLGG
jgi:ribonuclease HI